MRLLDAQWLRRPTSSTGSEGMLRGRCARRTLLWSSNSQWAHSAGRRDRHLDVLGATWNDGLGQVGDLDTFGDVVVGRGDDLCGVSVVNGSERGLPKMLMRVIGDDSPR